MDNTLVLWDLIELAGHLRQERLFVLSEQVHLQELNEKVVLASSRLAQSAWVTSQHRVNLNRLILSRPDCSPAMCCQRADSLELTEFIDSYKVLGYQDSTMYGQFLHNLRSAPELLASCLAAGDRIMPEAMPSIIHSLVAGLYGSCLLPEDKLLVLRLLKTLTELQLCTSDNPRRLLRHGSCAFSRLYSVFHEGLFSAKLFLTAALHGPIMQLLMEDEKFLDIDPDKAPIRFPPDERLRKFGKEGTAEYAANLQRYRAWTIKCLVNTTNQFIKSLRENLHCFPSSVCWLVRQIAALLIKSNAVEEKEVFAICTDLVLTFFICLAIVNPEPYGITDAPISYIARFNLIQVAQILQMLAMQKYEGVDPKVEDLYSQFDKDCVSNILEAMLEGTTNGQGAEEPAVADNAKLQGLSRSAALFTEAELYALVGFLQAVANDQADAEVKVDKKELDSVLSQLPHQNSSPTTHPKNSKINGQKGGGSKGGLRNCNSTNTGADALDEGLGGEEETNKPVLVIPFDMNSDTSVGFLSEQKVLEVEKNGVMVEELVRVGAVPVTVVGSRDRVESQEKRTRFSLSHDDGSIGNTSDNLEAVSEAASNHSVTSSLELENEDQNDNLSDMVSANVSGRGSPNISGRDTPSSQLTEGEEGGAQVSVGVEPRQASLEFVPSSQTAKQSRFDIDDKFGKFQIKKLIEGADETISMVSDTWSTDVLASDSEIMEAVPGAAEVVQQSLPGPPQLLDVSETASEAWSTDVVASDSERLTEVDTDDTASVARSDDTARSEVESRGDPEGGEESSSVAVGTSFRPIREEGIGSERLSIPISPTRVEGGNSQINPNITSSNVTGRGGAKSDYRRRTLEYVDSNRREFPNIPARSGGSLSFVDDPPRLVSSVDKPPDLKPALVASVTCHNISASSPAAVTAPSFSATPSPVSAIPSSGSALRSQSSLTTPKLAHFCSQQTSSQEVSIEESEGGTSGTGGVCLSTASLASTSSSGSSSEPRHKTTQDYNVPGTPLVLNGSVVMLEPSNSTNSKQLPSTGAIPKSISFDKTAERGDKESLDEDSKSKRGSFFRFRLPFNKNRRGKSFRGSEDLGRFGTGLGGTDVDSLSLRRGLSEESRSTRTDTSDDILAKYRRKVSGGDNSNANGSDNNKTRKSGESEVTVGNEPVVNEDERLFIDPANIESSYAFKDAKKKLRLVLSTAEVQQVPETTLTAMREAWSQKENELVAFLQLQLAEAINLQDRSLVAHLHETLRCVRLFDSQGCTKLFESLKEDYKSRTPYISYLIRCRQALLSTLAHLDRLTERVNSDRAVCTSFLMAVCVRLFLERRENMVARFSSEFQHLTLADEKNDLLDNFLQTLALEMERDPVWQAASESQLTMARTAIERSVISRVYIYAMYPNGDGDISRDQVLHEHMNKLSKVITPSHKDLRIPKMYYYECPWPSAQADIAAISAYKTPRDKLYCVFRCCTTIMNLLSLASDRSVPAADDLIPVLVYVLIKANPPSLLSTIQYINSFYGSRLEGEVRYWWVQFCSAIEFIKTMDYVDLQMKGRDATTCAMKAGMCHLTRSNVS
ncbi:GTPase activating protein and VPS9 domains 1 isoform X2 [Lycorma delicatula]|uniref:GTPase activating protein and VPS9 domains 1 isoform X2 n=1 Tax=Lycorma delicatula TaxID=130591 RepID=UPI003F5193F8